MLALGLPTGKYDHRRYDKDQRTIYDTVGSLVTPELQGGTGLYSLSLVAEHTFDKDWGPVIVGGFFSKKFRTPKDLISGNWGAQNDVWDRKNASDYKLLRGTIDSAENYMTWNGLQRPDSTLYDSTKQAIYLDDYAQWVQRADSVAAAYGVTWNTADEKANGLDSLFWNAPYPVITNNYYVRDKQGNKMDSLQGDFFGDIVGFNVAAGFKEEKCVHSLAFSYIFRLRPDWYVRVKDTELGNFTVKDIAGLTRSSSILPVLRENNRHLFNLTYGLEISSDYFPIFLAATMSIDGAGTIQSFNGTVGIQGSFF
jgi:hypothetical protein